MKMKYYMAPMESLTDYIYRSVYHARYRPVDKYFTPFLSPEANSSLSFQELSDILLKRNQGMYIVPQILTSQAEDFIRMAKELQEYGYSEMNLNLGCPSDTVASKHKGAGFLELPGSLNRSLDEACRKMEGMGMELSVKTGLGLVSPDKFTGFLEICNRYSLKELVLHPRVRTDYYKNIPNMPAFGNGFNGSRTPVCYSGNILTVSGYETLYEDCPELNRVVLGRGIISNPGLLDRIAAGIGSGETGTDKKTLRKFHRIIYEGCRTIMSGDRDVLFKMKGLWTCMIQIFSDNEKYIKRIKKLQRLEEYEAAATAVLRDLDIMEGTEFRTC